MKKGAIQLSMNFIVTIILSIVLLGLGIGFLQQFITGAQEIKQDIDAQTENKLTRQLDSGQQVAIAFNRKEIRRGNNEIFGVGILNIDSGQKFFVNVSHSLYVNESGKEKSLSSDRIPTPLYNSESFRLDKNERRIVPVSIDIPSDTPPGKYVYDVKVCYDGSTGCSNQYDNTKKIYATVPS